MTGKPIPKFEEVFESRDEQVNNDLVRELFMDYAQAWNEQWKAGKKNA